MRTRTAGEDPLAQNRSGDSPQLASRLTEIGRAFYGRGWALGTSGNFSAMIGAKPLRLAITSSGVDKGLLTAHEIVEIDENGRVVSGVGQPSSEAALHLTVVRARRAGAVFHTHSVWATLLSDAHADDGGISLDGFEMLKGLSGVSSHDYREWLPIIENSQDYPALCSSVEAELQDHPDSHGFLLRRHGLYTWGKDIQEAKRHVEILEFLLEVQGRSCRAAKPGE